MKFAYDVPGYLMGHRFTQDKRYYDSTNKRFYDLSGYSRFKGYCETTVGTPAFSNHGTYSREGVLLDRTCQMKFINPVPWEGTMIYVAKPTIAADLTALRLWIFGDAVTVTNNGLVSLHSTAVANQILGTSNTPAVSASAPILTINSANTTILVLAFAWDQETRKVYSTSDAITVNESAAAAGTTHGNDISMGWNGNYGLTGSVGSRYVRLGDNVGDGTSAADATHYAHLFEQHFFKGNVLRNNLAQVKEFFDSLKTYYGVA